MIAVILISAGVFALCAALRRRPGSGLRRSPRSGGLHRQRSRPYAVRRLRPG